MIFIINAQGDIINTVPESVYQGSNNANTIILAGPISPYTSVTAAFALPFGTTSPEYVMTPGGKFNGPEDLEEDWYYWTLSVPDTVTAYAGKVQVQFKCYNSSQLVATALGGFIVQPGVAPEEPPEPSSDDFYQQILDALALKQPIADSTLLPDVPTTTLTKTVSNAINYLYGQTEGLGEDKQDKTDNGLETTAKTVVGAINEVNEAAQEAVQTADEANTTAESAEATANAAKQTAEGISGKADTALQNANAAVTTANEAKETAEEAAGTAQEAKQTADGVDAKAQSALDAVSEADSVPTQNSVNLVLSGGTYAAIQQILADAKAYTNEAVSGVSSLKLQVVDSLDDVTEPSSTTIYLVPLDSTEQQNGYAEYLYLNNSWEMIGTTQVDLSNVYTKTEADGKFVAKEAGKGLSTNDFTTAEKNKLAGLSNYTLPQATTTVLGGVQLAAGSGQSESLVMHQKAVTDYVAAQIASAVTTALNANY